MQHLSSERLNPVSHHSRARETEPERCKVGDRRGQAFHLLGTRIQSQSGLVYAIWWVLGEAVINYWVKSCVLEEVRSLKGECYERFLSTESRKILFPLDFFLRV